LNKAPDAFRTISEVAGDLDLPQHVLRFWESRFPHIKPMKRGGGRRYYRPEDVDLLRGIRHLLYGDGYTIRGVQRILREQGVRSVQSIGQGHAVALPEPSAEEDEGEGGASDFLSPLFDGATAPAQRPRPPRRPQGAAAPSAQPALPFGGAPAPAPERASKALSPEDLDRLEGALAALEEARRLLDNGAGE
jgi:DNA-binding transcriptional MerR regulator